VVVVGKLLPTMPWMADNEKSEGISKPDLSHRIAIPKGADMFKVLSTKYKTTQAVIVRKVTDVRSTLFVLRDREHGLCRIEALPGQTDKAFNQRVAFYSGWTQGRRGREKNKIKRRKQWKNNIDAWCTEWRKDNNCDQPNLRMPLFQPKVSSLQKKTSMLQFPGF
jgi:hypothetical protein